MMNDLRSSRVERVHEIIRVVQEHGMKISFEDVERFAKGNTLGRPHVALALIEKGYASDLQDAFTRYLNEEGSCYVQRRKLNPCLLYTSCMDGHVAIYLGAGMVIDASSSQNAMVKREFGSWFRNGFICAKRPL